jgi:hypothetical protein
VPPRHRRLSRPVERQTESEDYITDQDIADLHARMRALEEVVAAIQDRLDQHVEADAKAFEGVYYPAKTVNDDVK